MKPRFRALFRARGLHRNALQSTDRFGHRARQEGSGAGRHANGEAVRSGRSTGISAIYVNVDREPTRDERSHVVLRDGATRIERRVYRSDTRPDAPDGGGNHAGRLYEASGHAWRAALVAATVGCILSACGGGGSTQTAPTTSKVVAPVPASQSAALAPFKTTAPMTSTPNIKDAYYG